MRTAANHVDNVEQVLIDAPTAGTYTIHLGRTGDAFTQAFSLLVSEEGDRFETNETRATAAKVGVGPGVHLPNLSLHNSSDVDWYEFEVLRADTVDVSLEFQHAFGNIDLEIYDATGTTLLGSSTSGTDDESVTLTLAAGTYTVHVLGDGGPSSYYSLNIDPGTASSTRMFYVNDGSQVHDFYTLVPGDDANDGLTPSTPKATVQDVLADYDVGPNDLVAIDTGTYGGSSVLIESADEGAAYAGTPGGSLFNYNGNRFDLYDADFNLLYGLEFGGGGGGTGVSIRPGAVDVSTNNVVRGCVFPGTNTAVWIDDGSDNQVLDNDISGSGSYGVYLTSGAAATIRDNAIQNVTYGIYQYSSPSIGNSTIVDNIIHHTLTGIYVSGSTFTVNDNIVHHTTKGIESSSSGATVFGNEIYASETGLLGYGILGGTDWSAGQPNDIHDNVTGIVARNSATVRFNRVHHNAVGISPDSTNIDVHHNVIYRNTQQGILVDGGHDVVIENNTIYATAGEGVRLRESSYNVTLRNNIIYGDGDYGIYVATDSQRGFASDYNNLYTSSASTLVWWQKPFDDLFDWQVEADFDTHSIGYTTLDPTQDDPQFVNLAGDDYHLTAVVSTSIDSGDPSSLYANEPAPDGGYINLGAYGNTSQAALSDTRYVRIDYPDHYTDWPADIGRPIQWHTYDSTSGEISGSVDIDLWEVGGSKVADIAIAAATDGSYGWSPQASGITPSTTTRYEIIITSIDHPTLSDTSREGFSVPVTGTLFYVNDASLTDDQYTTAVGNNRNTGKTAADPKANLLPLLRSYNLAPADEVRIDTGNYIHVRNVIISGNTILGDDEGATFTGPSDPGKTAVIDRANPYTDSTNIELNDGDYVNLQYLTLTGAYTGLWVRNGSTNFDGQHLVVSNNTQNGIVLESDAEASTVDYLTAHHNGGTGIYISTPLASVSNSKAYANGQYGIQLNGTGATRLESNDVYGNNIGIYVDNYLSGDPTVVGNTDLSLDKGNRVHDNVSMGIYAFRNVLVAGNHIYGHTGSGDVGLYLYGARATRNVVQGNFRGITSDYYGSSTMEYNRVYNNTTEGIYSSGSDVLPRQCRLLQQSRSAGKPTRSATNE